VEDLASASDASGSIPPLARTFVLHIGTAKPQLILKPTTRKPRHGI